MKRLITSILIIISVNIYGQDFNKMKKQADEQFEYENYHLCLPVYYALIKTDSTNKELNYKLAVSIYKIERDKTKAIKYFEKSLPQYPDAYFYLGILYRINGLLNKSEEMFIKYKNVRDKKSFDYETVDYQLKKTHTAKEMLK